MEQPVGVEMPAPENLPDEAAPPEHRQDPLLAGLIVLAIVLLVTLSALIVIANSNMPADLR